jgi:hypothetical protein
MTIIFSLPNIAISFFLLVVVHPLWGSTKPITLPNVSSMLTSNTSKELWIRTANSPNQPAQDVLHALPIDSNPTPATTLAPRPELLEPIPSTKPNPVMALDELVSKQQSKLKPYIPFIKMVFVGTDYSMWLMNAYNKIAQRLSKKAIDSETEYEFALGLLFRKNIQLASNVGYAHLHPPHTTDNFFPYQVKGIYGRIGLDYVLYYRLQDNLHIGFRYGRSYFHNTTKPVNATSIRKALEASWFELVIGGTSPLWTRHGHGLYLGWALQVKTLLDYMPFTPANNYVIPGYGRTKNWPSIGLSLYIQYNLSFLNRLITFN